MITEVFVICDAANDSHGKLNILGAFDTIVAAEFPFVHPHCTIALRLRYDSASVREHAIKLDLQGASGAPLLASIDTVMKSGVSPNATATANLIVNINSLRFEKPGDYSFVLKVDGLPTAVTPLYIRATQPGGTVQ
jgi:hypothetical protein